MSMTNKTIIQISILIGGNVKSSEFIEIFVQNIACQQNDKLICSTKLKLADLKALRDEPIGVDLIGLHPSPREHIQILRGLKSDVEQGPLQGCHSSLTAS